MSIIIMLKRVELEAEVNVQVADGKPVDGSLGVELQPLASMKTTVEMKPATIAPMDKRRSRCDVST